MTQTSFGTPAYVFPMPPAMPARSLLSFDRSGAGIPGTTDTLLANTNQSLQVAAERYWPDTPQARKAACDLLAQFIAAATRLEALGWSSDCIKNALGPSRRVFAESAFMKRCQEWPRGYAGDFETIEYLAGAVNCSKAGTIAWHFEQILLESPVTRQHRNKLDRQTAEIVNVLDRRPNARILSVACGGCLDWIRAFPALDGFKGEIVLNDHDPAALELAANRFADVTRNYRLAPGNILRVARRLTDTAKFDLAIAGGLFDYLTDRAIVSLLGTIYGQLLAPGGTLLFTNMAQGNPWRALMEYGSDWHIIERSEDQIQELCSEAGIRSSEVDITRDATGLTLLIQIVREA